MAAKAAPAFVGSCDALEMSDLSLYPSTRQNSPSPLTPRQNSPSPLTPRQNSPSPPTPRQNSPSPPTSEPLISNIYVTEHALYRFITYSWPSEPDNPRTLTDIEPYSTFPSSESDDSFHQLLSARANEHATEQRLIQCSRALSARNPAIAFRANAIIQLVVFYTRVLRAMTEMRVYGDVLQRHFPGKDFNEVLTTCRNELLDTIALAEETPLTKVSGLNL